MYKVMGKP